MKLGIIFPGQGSQVVGMGLGVVAAFPVAAEIFARASDVLGYDLVALVRDGTEEQLRETRFSQPAIYVTNYALAAASESLDVCIVSAGHSFGEYCSLTIAESLQFEDALRLVNERALAMQQAAEETPGSMAAILGLDVAAVRAAAEAARHEGRVQLANFNAPGQIVVSGDAAAVQRAGDLAMEAGAKRVVPLNVSGAWHSVLMESARVRFAPFVESATIRPPVFSVISNVDARRYESVAAVRHNLIASLTTEVLWHETAERLIQEGPELVVEFGASPVLAPLFRRMPGAPKVFHAGDAASLTKLRTIIEEQAA
ncbi:MAG: ACP S-malonyltransferase [Candidatus Eremiobacteraeota bacterium]|nr:ACP S-malonyltransferase [Candidatus Eremiobacteraeota bacterium]